jgi:hypothetical protein
VLSRFRRLLACNTDRRVITTRLHWDRGCKSQKPATCTLGCVRWSVILPIKLRSFSIAIAQIRRPRRESTQRRPGIFAEAPSRCFSYCHIKTLFRKFTCSLSIRVHQAILNYLSHVSSSLYSYMHTSATREALHCRRIFIEIVQASNQILFNKVRFHRACIRDIEIGCSLHSVEHPYTALVSNGGKQPLSLPLETSSMAQRKAPLLTLI